MSYEKLKSAISNVSGKHSDSFEKIIKELKIKIKDITDYENYVETLDFLEGLSSQLGKEERKEIESLLKIYVDESGYEKKNLKESFSFNEYLEFLNESVDSDFPTDVYHEFGVIPYVTFGKDKAGKNATAKLDDVKRIGTYSCNIYPNSEKDIAVTISLKPVDSNKIVTLVETVINIETPDWKKKFKKFIDEARKIVEKLSELNQAH